METTTTTNETQAFLELGKTFIAIFVALLVIAGGVALGIAVANRAI